LQVELSRIGGDNTLQLALGFIPVISELPQNLKFGIVIFIRRNFRVVEDFLFGMFSQSLKMSILWWKKIKIF
jgi:hypothetical protein